MQETSDQKINRRIGMSVGALIVGAMLLTSCASFQGHGSGGTKEEWTDGHGRVCTAVKWGDSASIDCDFPEK